MAGRFIAFVSTAIVEVQPLACTAQGRAAPQQPAVAVLAAAVLSEVAARRSAEAAIVDVVALRAVLPRIIVVRSAIAGQMSCKPLSFAAPLVENLRSRIPTVVSPPKAERCDQNRS